MIRYACIIPRGPKSPHSNKSGSALNVAVPKATTVVTVATPSAGRRDFIAAKAPVLASLGWLEIMDSQELVYAILLDYELQSLLLTPTLE